MKVFNNVNTILREFSLYYLCVLLVYLSFIYLIFCRYTPQLGKDLAIEILGRSNKEGSHCRVWVNKLDRKDGTFIVRYKMYETCYEVSINVYYKSKHIKGSPLKFSGR